MAANGFGSMTFTTNGLNLLAKAQTGTALNFTRIAVGDGILNGQDTTALNNLLNQVLSLNISEFIVNGTGSATIGATLSNTSLSTGFYWREIGIFATDPQLGEILYGYANTNDGDIFVPPSTTSVFTTTCNISVIVSNVASVTATIDNSLVFAKLSDVPTKISQLANDAGYITAAQIPAVPVQSVNGKTGAVSLAAGDVGAEPAITGGAVSQYWSGTKTWRTLAADVLAVALTGLSTATNTVISTADTVLSALGKLQAQITAIKAISNVVIQAHCSETLLSTTNATNVLTFTPTVQDNFNIGCYVRVVTATTNVVVTATWTDASGIQSSNIFNGYLAVGSYYDISTFFNSVANQPITLTVTAGTANQAYVSASIVGV
jgi:hypothetical protein